MLYNLHVKNLAIIDEVEVTFSEGFNVLTGETGAGKSILIDSINIVLGGRIPKGIIREGCEAALIEVIFTVENDMQKKVLEEMQISPEDDQVIISRKISENRTINRINGENVTVSALKKVGSAFIDVHGQHEHQSLLSTVRHREIVDEFAGSKVEKIKIELLKNYLKYKEIRAELDSDTMSESEREREISFLEFELNEIEKAKLKSGEEAELEVEYKKLQNAQGIAENMNEVYSLTSGSTGALSQVGEALHALKNAVNFDEELSSSLEELSQIDDLLNDFNREIDAYMADFTVDDERLNEVIRRLDLIRGLKAKYGNSTADVLNYADEISEKLKKFKEHDEREARLKEKLSEKGKKIAELSSKLSDERKKAAEKLDKKLIKALKDLNFAQVVFKTSIEKSKNITADGGDMIEFMVSLNPGVEPRPLIQAASGGELSRIMLALKSIFAENDRISTLIFDEIDTGISGRTAQKVAEKISGIASNHQVICISHLAQIAAMADAHYLIEKENDSKSTKTGIRKLNDDEIINELARILGGVSITDAVLESAREMKEMAKKSKA